jgi:hypothetical protein
MAAAQRLYRQGARAQRQGRRRLQDVLHQFHQRQELVPNERIRYTNKFDDPNMPGEMQGTVQIKKVLAGAEVHIEQTNLPSQIPLEGCYLGWRQSLI